MKDFFKNSGGNGGLIIAMRIPDKARTQEIQAMIKSLRDYGRY
jgi:hypothetical protein